VESADLGFLIQVLQETDNGPKSSLLETRVLKLTGEVLYMTTCTVCMNCLGKAVLTLQQSPRQKNMEGKGLQYCSKVLTKG